MKVFTTGQVAKICKVAPRTVSKWFDTGRLRGYRIPGSQDRRIPREYLIQFLKEHGMPVGDLEDQTVAKVMIITQDQTMIDRLKKELCSRSCFRMAVAGDGFTAGVQAKNFHPDCMIIDFSIGRDEALEICRKLRQNVERTSMNVIVLLPVDSRPVDLLDRSVIHEIFQMPFDVALLAERLKTLIGVRKELA